MKSGSVYISRQPKKVSRKSKPKKKKKKAKKNATVKKVYINKTPKFFINLISLWHVNMFDWLSSCSLCLYTSSAKCLTVKQVTAKQDGRAEN